MLNKIFIIATAALFAVILAGGAYINHLLNERTALLNENSAILSANHDLNETLSEVIKQNEKEREVLSENYEKTIQNLNKKAQIKQKVSENNESDVVVLFGGVVRELFEQNASSKD